MNMLKTTVLLAAAEDVEVDVVDGLAALIADVECEPVASLADALRLREPVRHRGHAPQQRPLLLLHVSHASDVDFGDDQQMHRRARVDIADGEAEVVVVQLLDGHLAGDHVAEEAVCGHAPRSIRRGGRRCQPPRCVS